MSNSATDPDITGDADLPLTRLSLALPYLNELDRRGVQVHETLERLNLSRDVMASRDSFVHISTMYALLEAFAATARDPFLSVAVGASLDMDQWPLFSDAVRRSSTVGEFFCRFTMRAGEHATSVDWVLSTDGVHATFKSRRRFVPDMVPAQNDGFYVGMMVNIFNRTLGVEWQPACVEATVCDPLAVPERFGGIRVRKGDLSGPCFSFPMAWLVHSFARRTASAEPGALTPPPSTLLESLRESLKPFLHRPDLSTVEAAELCGFKERALRRRLHGLGTSLAHEIAMLRKQRAQKLLTRSDISIADVGEAVGFHDASSFTRSFKRWTGMSPRSYRKQNRERPEPVLDLGQPVQRL